MEKLQVSILGDSISTYSRYNPKGYAVYYDIFAKKAYRMNSVRDTWWSQVLRGMKAKLCVNGSFSGSKVSGGEFPAAESEERIKALQKNGIIPDMILIYIGFNDFACAVDIEEFSDAYAHMLSQLKSYYPDSQIICGTLMRTYVKDVPIWEFPDAYNGLSIDVYNDAIRAACHAKEVLIADLAKQGNGYETRDCAHPTVKGHIEIADAWKECLEGILSEKAGKYLSAV